MFIKIKSLGRVIYISCLAFKFQSIHQEPSNEELRFSFFLLEEILYSNKTRLCCCLLLLSSYNVLQDHTSI